MFNLYYSILESYTFFKSLQFINNRKKYYNQNFAIRYMKLYTARKFKPS